MAWGRIKTEHSGAKRGKGYWGRKAAAKQASKRARRREDHPIPALDDRPGAIPEAEESASGES